MIDAIRRRCALFVLLLGVFAGGCSEQPSGPATYPVTGVVTQGGQPVAGAVVQFTPTADGAGAQAQTGEDGAFAVHATFDQGKTNERGLPAGEYQITVVKMETAGGASLNSPPQNTLPAEYGTVQTTPLEATVKANGENRVELTLE